MRPQLDAADDGPDLVFRLDSDLASIRSWSTTTGNRPCSEQRT